ncbi:hypothetical protein [Micromonospora zamorensis]
MVGHIDAVAAVRVDEVQVINVVWQDSTQSTAKLASCAALARSVPG